MVKLLRETEKTRKKIKIR